MQIYQANMTYRACLGASSVTTVPTYHATKRGACDAVLAVSNDFYGMSDEARTAVREMLCRILETDTIISSGRKAGVDEYVAVSVVPKTVGA